MSGFSSMALPGGIPMSGTGRNMITPESLFGSANEKAAYKRLIDDAAGSHAKGIRVKKVCVRVFDFSDKKQVRAYEKLWAELLEKTARMEVVVESHRDLVQRKDGTSYWMKYVEYVEFGEDSDTSDSSSMERKD